MQNITNQPSTPYSYCLSALLLSFSIIVAGCSTFGTAAKSEALISHQKGEELYKDERYGDAIPHFLNVIQQFPNNPITEISMYYLANAYAKSGKTAEAQRAYQQLIEDYRSGFWVNSSKNHLEQLHNQQ